MLQLWCCDRSMPLIRLLPCSQPWWKYLHGVALVGLLLRLAVALLSDFVYHPDEIFQYLEQAHRLVFGYGYIPWEYRYGIRSWLLPGFLTLVLQGIRWLHLDSPHSYIPLMKGLGCLLSVSLIYAAYVVGWHLASELAGRLASGVVCGWHELIAFAAKLTPEVLATYSLTVALACLVAPPGRWRAIAFGLLCALTVALRLQYLPAVAVLALAALVLWVRHYWGTLLLATCAFGLGIGLAGWLDYISWGSFFASYINNYLYNQVYGISSVWGDSPPSYYVRLIAENSYYLFPAAIAVSLIRPPRPWLLLVLVASIVVPHSLIGHKEPRFILAAVPLLAIILGMAWASLVTMGGSWRKTAGPDPIRRISQRWLAIATATLLAVLCWRGVLQDTAGLANKGILTAYRYLYDQPRLAVLLNLYTPWYGTGGYYYLHRDLPIYTQGDLTDAAPADYQRYVSHIVCAAGEAAIPGFVPIAQFGDVEVRQLQLFPDQYETIDAQPRQPQQPEVDGVYQPTVQPRW